MKRSIISFLVTFLLYSCSTSQNIEVALITGHTDKYHNCEVMSAHITQLLTENPRFITTVVDVKAPENEVIDFDNYDVVIMNINDMEWSEIQMRSFEEYISAGGGLVVVHEADNAFPQWKGYNEMIALGGWGGRNTPESGPFYYYSDGQFVTDSLTLGAGGRHGKRVPFEINVRDSEHPIMRGLPQSWMHYDDELYGNLRGPAKNIHPLATAFSDSQSGGTGKEELVLFTVSYDKGRIFHTVLGHTGKDFDKSLHNRGFNVTLLRGTEWAATGEVEYDVTFE